jgi:hypothetical protein
MMSTIIISNTETRGHGGLTESVQPRHCERSEAIAYTTDTFVAPATASSLAVTAAIHTIARRRARSLSPSPGGGWGEASRPKPGLFKTTAVHSECKSCGTGIDKQQKILTDTFFKHLNRSQHEKISFINQYDDGVSARYL